MTIYAVTCHLDQLSRLILQTVQSLDWCDPIFALQSIQPSSTSDHVFNEFYRVTETAFPLLFLGFPAPNRNCGTMAGSYLYYIYNKYSIHRNCPAFTFILLPILLFYCPQLKLCFHCPFLYCPNRTARNRGPLPVAPLLN